MAREYFCAYHSYLQQCKGLSDGELGRLFRALLQYSATGAAPEFNGRESVAFDFMAANIDRDAETYEMACNRNRENALKRYDRIRPHATACETCQEKEEEKEELKEKKECKEKKKKFGSYQNVLLSDSDVEKLKQKFPNDWESRIESLSEGIELKGYKYKNHYLAILKWAERDQKYVVRTSEKGTSTPVPKGQKYGNYL